MGEGAAMTAQSQDFVSAGPMPDRQKPPADPFAEPTRTAAQRAAPAW